jgi:hypothetical protein
MPPVQGAHVPSASRRSGAQRSMGQLGELDWVKNVSTWWFLNFVEQITVPDATNAFLISSPRN